MKKKPSDLEQMIGYCALVTTIVERIERRRARGNEGIRDRELRMMYGAAMQSIWIGMKAMSKQERSA